MVMDQLEMDAAQWWGRSERYEEEQERLKREFKELEEEYRLWAIKNVDLTPQLECQS
jgi:hypothetical protein